MYLGFCFPTGFVQRYTGRFNEPDLQSQLNSSKPWNSGRPSARIVVCPAMDSAMDPVRSQKALAFERFLLLTRQSFEQFWWRPIFPGFSFFSDQRVFKRKERKCHTGTAPSSFFEDQGFAG